MTTCDLRHEWVTVYGVKKHLVLQPNWCFLMAFQISHGLVDGLHEFLSTCADRDVEKISEAILIVLSLHMVVIELQHMHHLANVSVILSPKHDLVLLKSMDKLMMSLEYHVVHVM